MLDSPTCPVQKYSTFLLLIFNIPRLKVALFAPGTNFLVIRRRDDNFSDKIAAIKADPSSAHLKAEMAVPQHRRERRASSIHEVLNVFLSFINPYIFINF